MNPVALRLFIFIGQRALGAVVSCAAIMAFKAALEKHNIGQRRFNYARPQAVRSPRPWRDERIPSEVVDQSTGEVYAIR